MDEALPEAEALAVRWEKIVAIGSSAEMQEFIGPETEVIDLEGRLAIPGFIEGHGHYLALGDARRMLDLGAAESWEEIVAMVGEAAGTARPGSWIRGQGWHQEKWKTEPAGAIDGLPVHAALSRVSPHNPVQLSHSSGHALLVNAAALELAGINAKTLDPPVGEIVRDGQGEPTGILRESAQDLVYAAYARQQSQLAPETREADLFEQFMLAADESLSKGITTFHDAGAPFAVIDFYRTLAEGPGLPLRLYVMVGLEESNDSLAANLETYRRIDSRNRLTVRSIKRMVDGALGSHGAWLLEPYADRPESTGLNLYSMEELGRTAELAMQYGYQLNTHAIGDRANREVLNVYEQAFRNHPEQKDPRWRVEHAQHLHPDDVPRFGELGVIASMQGVHATSDGPWVPKRLGAERSRNRTYVWRRLWDAGAVVTNGTDVPVEDVNPIMSYYASVSRRMADGTVFNAEQRLTREEALRSYTINNAYAAFEEDIKGSLSVGKLGDIVVLSRDITRVREEEIPGTEVIYTIVGGTVQYRHPSVEAAAVP